MIVQLWTKRRLSATLRVMNGKFLKVSILVTGLTLTVTLKDAKEVRENDLLPKANSHSFIKRYSAHNHHIWSYTGSTGPARWSKMYPTCGGNQQSPININTNVTETDETLEPFAFVGYEAPLQEAFITNNGHTVKVASKAAVLPSIEGGGLESRYSFLQFHFHWGDSDSRGSEHLINGRRFPMEMHVVHKNNKQTTEEEAATVVLAILLQASKENNPTFDIIVESLDRVQYKDSTSDIKGILRLSAFLPDDDFYFYRYIGSLTTPPCTEGVVWTIFADPVPIGTSQLEAFRRLQSNAETSKGYPRYMMNNFRNLQRLNGRQILESLPQC